jgi:hypothetical protein
MKMVHLCNLNLKYSEPSAVLAFTYVLRQFRLVWMRVGAWTKDGNRSQVRVVANGKTDIMEVAGFSTGKQ